MAATMNHAQEHIHDHGFTRVFSDAAQEHRFALLHVFDMTEATRWLTVITATPQSCSAEFHDRATHRAIMRGQRLGYDGVALLNVHSKCTARSMDTWRHKTDPCGRENHVTAHAVLARMLGATRRAKHMDVLCAWGSNTHGREAPLLDLLRAYSHPTYCLGLTPTGVPLAPYSLPRHTEMKPWLLPLK